MGLLRQTMRMEAEQRRVDVVLKVSQSVPRLLRGGVCVPSTKGERIRNKEFIVARVL